MLKLDQQPELSKKLLGAYYTPFDAAEVLASWAIRSKKDLVLEPSFGACGFIEAISKRFGALGADSNLDNVFGCDIDPDAFNLYLEPKFGINAEESSNFTCEDFLKIDPNHFSNKKFDVVIGNPPYVSYHNMNDEMRVIADKCMVKDGYTLTPRASLWAHFVLHAIEFVEIGGRVAWILPSSFIHTDYSAVVRKYVSESFEQVMVIQLGERLFLSEGTEEIAVILLAENRLETTNKSPLIKSSFVKNLSDLSYQIKELEGESNANSHTLNKIFSPDYFKISTESIDGLESENQVYKLGEIADIKIGIVTGQNSFFVIENSIARKHQLNETSLKPILAKFSQAKGAEITIEDLEKNRFSDQKMLLVNTESEELVEKGSPLRNYLSTLPRHKRRSVKTFKKRLNWHQPDDGKIPDAFFPYMYHSGPRLILNLAQVNSTNTIHRVYFKGENLPSSFSKETFAKLVSLSILSTYSQLSGEIEGRTYGSGVLKHEPSEVKNIRVLIPHEADSEEVDDLFEMVDMLLRQNRVGQVQLLVDRYLFKNVEIDEKKTILNNLEEALFVARSRRMRGTQYEKLRGKILNGRE